MAYTTTAGAGAPPPATTRGEPVAITWSGSTWGLAGLGFINLLLTIITLGIYHFWAKTEVRRRIISSVRINGEPMEYTGTGTELFLGFLIVLFLILLPIQLIVFGARLTLGPAGGAVIFLILPLILYLYGVAVFRARRYRRSRIRWRGVRGAMVGSSWAYGWHALWSGALLPFTLMFLWPWRDNFLHGKLMRAGRFGDRSFGFTGRSGPLYPRFTLVFLGQFLALALIGSGGGALIYTMGKPLIEASQQATANGGTIDWNSPEMAAFKPLMAAMIGLGVGFYAGLILSTILIWSFYRSRVISYFASHTILDRASFGVAPSGWGLFWVTFSGLLISLLTLTILSPVAEARVARYLVRRMTVTGTVDFAGIVQSAQTLSKTGEGLAEAFDVDASSSFILSL